jgi:hypothetical protein
LAWLFYRRIEMLAGFYNVEVAMILGPLMAHEMGHLLLPYRSHTASGLMKGGWDSQQTRLATTGGMTFEESQAGLIRARVQQMSQPPVQGR